MLLLLNCPKCNVKKTIHFGAEGMSDFTKHKDPQRKERYYTKTIKAVESQFALIEI